MINVEIKKSEQFNSEYSAFISFDYNSEIVTAIKTMPFRYYNTTDKTWELPANNLQELINKLGDFDIRIVGLHYIINNEKDELFPKGFEFKTEPYSHQVEGLKYGLANNYWFLGDEQGLGKTKQAIDIAVARKIKYGYKHCLIVCGVNGLKWNWRNEIITHSNEAPWILGQKENKNGKIKIGSTTDKIKDLKWLLENETTTYFLITNVESFRNEEFSKVVKELCDKKIINMCVADEMHKMKNPTAQQTKGFLKCLPECRIGMTGTPLMNTPLDLYVILRWLGYESHAFYSFKKHYCIMGGYGGYEVVGYQNLEQLTSQVNAIMLRRLKSDVLDLPEKTYIDEYVEMEGKQATLYNEVRAGIATALATGELDITNPLAVTIRLRQTTGYPGIISDEIKDSAKLDRMEDLVEEAISNNQKVVIFSNWTQMTDEIYRRLCGKNYGVSVITGNTKDEDRQSVVNLFQNSSNCNVLIGTIGAMGTGLTLTAGSVVIFVDEPWNKALYEQAVDRCHRIGQNNNITIYNLLTKDTVDERIHNVIYKKGLMSDFIIDGKEIDNKKAFIEYLIS